MCIRKNVPYWIYKKVWGDRKKFGLQPDVHDFDWKIWQDKAFNDFYPTTQQQGIGDRVSRMAYPVISRVDFGDKHVLEIGPGMIRHLPYIKSKPARYTICDINEDVLGMAEKQLKEAEIPCETIFLDREGDNELPFSDESFDVVISFNSLEHLYPLDDYLFEIKRILKVGALLIGGIPCEGGLVWGLGRLLTTRRYVHKNYGINYDKIICWEHPNFADFIIERLDTHFEREHLKLHPFSCLPIDFNLVASFIYKQIKKPS
jgi:SAM-dependent methyltransferase